jgi:hypothetical protein
MATNDSGWEKGTEGTELGVWGTITDLQVQNFLNEQLVELEPIDPLFDTLVQVINVDEQYQRQPFVLADITAKYKELYNEMRHKTYVMTPNANHGLMVRRALNKYFTKKFLIVTGEKITLGSYDDKLYPGDKQNFPPRGFGSAGKKTRRQTRRKQTRRKQTRRKQTRRKQTRRSK